MSTTKRLTNATGERVADNTNIMTAGPRVAALLQDCADPAYGSGVACALGLELPLAAE